MTIKNKDPPPKVNWFKKYSSGALPSYPPPLPRKKWKRWDEDSQTKYVLDGKETSKWGQQSDFNESTNKDMKDNRNASKDGGGERWKGDG